MTTSYEVSIGGPLTERPQRSGWVQARYTFENWESACKQLRPLCACTPC